MNNGDTWTDADGQEMKVLATYWNQEPRTADAERLASRYDGAFALTEEPNPIETEVPELKTLFYLSAPAGEFSRASNALYGI